MEEMVRKINAVHAINQDIIARVENTAEVITYRYYASKQDGAANKVVLEEEAIHTDVKDIIEEFRFTGELRTDLWDVFIITPRPRTWDDLKKLNNRLHAAVKDFEQLKDSDRMQKELRKYLDNLEIIQTGLGHVEERTISEQSRLIEMQESLVFPQPVMALQQQVDPLPPSFPLHSQQWAWCCSDNVPCSQRQSTFRCTRQSELWADLWWQHDLRIASNVNKDICSFSNFPDSFTDSTGKGSRLLFGARNIQLAELEVYGMQ